MADVPASWRLSQEEQTQQFINFAPKACRPPVSKGLQGVVPIGEPQELELDTETQVSLKESSAPMVRLMGNFILLGVGSPLATFGATLPLFVRKLPQEIWISYFWTLQYGAAVVFAELTVRMCFDHVISAKRLLVGWLCSSSFSVCVVCFGRVGYGQPGITFFMLLVNLNLPLILRLLDCWNRTIPCRPLLMHCACWCFGSLPMLTSVVLYIVVESLHWMDHWTTTLLSSLLWSAAPLAARPLGSLLWMTFSPASKLFGPVIWRFYSDIGFATLGLAMFMQTPLAAAANVASSVCLLVALALRGRPEVFDAAAYLCCLRGPEDTLITWRIFTFFDALSLLVARALAYILYLCMVTMHLVVGEDIPFQERPHLTDASTFAYSAQIYRNIEPTGADIIIGLVCLAITVIAFGCFCWLLPVIWTGHTTEPNAEAVERPNAEVVGHRFRWADGAHALPKPHAWCKSSRSASRYEDSSVQEQQVELLSHFLINHRAHVAAMLAFQVGVTISSVSAAQHFLERPN